MDREVLRLYQYWVLQRELIRVRRWAGKPPPWTTDLILAEYRFCNVRREDDRVTVWLRKNVREAYVGNPNLFFMLCLARLINWPPTLFEVMQRGLWPVEAYRSEALTDLLEERARREKVWTGAYLLGRSPGGRPRHIAGEVLRQTWFALQNRPLPGTMQEAHRYMLEVPGWGNFLAYQVIVDARFTEVLGDAPDRHSWCAAGPGTIAGLNYLHGRPPGKGLSQNQALEEIRELEPHLRNTGIRFDFSDIPNILCEGSKYVRMTRGGRMRARFLPTEEVWGPLRRP